eukprot:TRINITY_DN7158_c0_g1_i1.p1 TRINITY_DN7158_c0_g1~~TRINITY_DN7158_c0_g1_i1.p1  ORF type:complete len:333 (-),score=44.14 TRINITY_DN7158_c0_g1_i1:31-966(-)
MLPPMCSNGNGPCYGAAVSGDYPQHPRDNPSVKKRTNTNHNVLLTSLILPCLIFAVVAWTLIFSVHFFQSQLCSAIVTGCGFFVVFLGCSAYLAWRKGGETSLFWSVFLFLTSGLAWLVAFGFGTSTYINLMEPFFSTNNLNTYPSIDPSQFRGNQLMDIGRVTFVSGSYLDLTKSLGFRNTDVYCVAPIVSDNSSMLVYDFWAVGRNCCSGRMPDFACGEFNNPKAHSGLRLLQEDLRPYYRLAVQQAEATYNIKVQHPVFLYWMEDPTVELNAYEDEGYKRFLLGACIFFAVQLCLVFGGAVAVSKMMR